MPQAQLDGWETEFRFSDDIAQEAAPEAPYPADTYEDVSRRRSRRRAQRSVMTSALRPSHALRAVTFEQEGYTGSSRPTRHGTDGDEMDEAFLNAMADKLTDRLMNYLRDPDVMRDLLAQERQHSAQQPNHYTPPQTRPRQTMQPPLRTRLSSHPMPPVESQRMASEPKRVDAETLLEDNIMLARQIKRLQGMVDERQDVINWLNAEYQGFRHVLGSLYLKV